METNFISGSENLYKYLVSIGLLLIVMTVFYPLKEKQDLEVSQINTEKDAVALNYKIKKTAERVENLRKNIKANVSKEDLDEKLTELDDLLNKNQIEQFELERKGQEIEIRKKHISLYNTLFWIFFPLGVILTIFGFIKWLKSKTLDDDVLGLEKKKLELEIEKLENE